MTDKVCSLCSGRRWIIWSQQQGESIIPLIEPCRCNPGKKPPPFKGYQGYPVSALSEQEEQGADS